MKKLIMGGLLLASPAVFATPLVGDFAEFDRQTSKNGQATMESLSQELLSYDGVAKKFQERLTVQAADGSSKVSEKFRYESEFLSDQEIANILSKCHFYGGHLETLATQVGNIKACALPMDDGMNERTIWYGKVPFGIVKDDITLLLTGDRQVLTIKNYRFGNK